MAAAVTRIEREARGSVPPGLGLQRLGEELADGVPEADVGGRAGAWRLADGGLVHFQHAVDGLVACQALAARPDRVFAAGQGLAPSLGGLHRDGGLHVRQQHVTCQRALAGAGHPRHRHQAPQRDAHVHLSQVVKMSSLHGERGRLALFRERAGHGDHRGRKGRDASCASACLRGLNRPARLQRVLQRLRQQPAGERLGAGREIGHRALRHQAPAALARTRADVDQVVGPADGVLVMLHHHQRVALVAQLMQGVEQDAVVARVQADGGLVQHVAHALQVAAQLRRQADALRLTARESGRGAVQREVAQAHLLQELQAAADFGDHIAGDAHLAPAQSTFGQPVQHPAMGLAHAHVRHLADGLAEKRDGP